MIHVKQLSIKKNLKIICNIFIAMLSSVQLAAKNHLANLKNIDQSLGLNLFQIYIDGAEAHTIPRVTILFSVFGYEKVYM